MKNIYEQVDENKNKSNLVIVSFILFISLASYLITYSLGYDLSALGVAMILSGLISFAGYYYSDKMILTMSGAKPARRTQHFDFFTVTENIARVAKIPTPKIYVIEDTSMNAFATGRDPQHAVVCATTGLLSRLNRTELEAVVAHEIGHIKNYDTRLASIVTILVGSVTLLADILLRTRIRGNRDHDNNGQLETVLFIAGIVMALLSPLIAKLIQLSISRRREFYADSTSALLTRYPEGLISALQKISSDTEPLEAANKATAHLYFSNPLKNQKGAVNWFAKLFNTHPPVEERIAALRGEGV